MDQHTSPSFSQLSALRQLELSDCTFHPEVLQGCPKLQELHVRAVEYSYDADTDGTALLAVLPKLQALEVISLDQLSIDWPAAAPAYTALVASSSLDTLHISDCDLPVGVWQHIFAAGQQLPLWLLELQTGTEGKELDDVYPGMVLNTTDLKHTVNACPGLGHLAVMLQPGTDHLPLTQLSALKSLKVTGTSAAGICAIATLTVLSKLSLCPTADAVVQYDWLPLVTAMRQLTQLECISYDKEVVSSDDDSDDNAGSAGVQLCLRHGETPEHPDPDVWVKLVKVLAENSTTASTIASSLAKELAQAQQQIGIMGQQLAQQSAQLEAQQQAAVQEKTRLANLGRQLAEQRASSASQAAQIAELQQQVQQLVQALQQGGGQRV